MRSVQIAVASALMGLGAAYAQADTIQITPASQTSTNRQLVTSQIVASGFNSAGAPSIGAYDLNISFDPTVLSFVSASFGTALDVFGLGDIQSVTPGSGTVELFELSLDTADDLNAFQPDTFSLAELNFQAIGVGTSSLTLTANAISDASGNSLPVSLEGASVQIEPNQSPSAVTPEPPSILLCVTGLLMMVSAMFCNKAILSKRDRLQGL